MKTARDEANIALVASDESCAWGESVILRGDAGARSGRGGGSLCLPRGVKKNERRGDIEIPLRSVSSAALAPTLDAIDALASYLEAVNTILARKDGKAIAAQGDIAAITKADLRIIPTLTADQQSAITGLIKLIGEIAAEQRKADELQVIVGKQNAAVLDIIQKLKASIAKWSRSSLAGDLQLTDDAYVSLGRQLGANPPVYRGFENRRAVLQMIVTARRNAAAVDSFSEGAIKALGEVQQAQIDLFDAFTDHPRWTRKEKAKAARINRERVLGALHSIASIVTAF